jgi:hypothetical protein
MMQLLLIIAGALAVVSLLGKLGIIDTSCSPDNDTGGNYYDGAIDTLLDK